MKFGKSEAGAVWLDPALTSPFKFYQFWLNVDDADVEDYLKLFTVLDKPAIGAVMKEFHENKGVRAAQKLLAYETTSLIHGKKQADSVRKVSEVLFGKGEFLDLSTQEQNSLADELTTVKVGKTLAETLVSAALATSNSEANRFVTAGSVSINGQKVVGDMVDFQPGLNLLKRGKNSFAVVQA